MGETREGGRLKTTLIHLGIQLLIFTKKPVQGLPYDAVRGQA